MKKLLFVAVAILIVSSLSLAQMTAGKMAFSSDIMTGGGGSIGGAYALSENMRLDIGLSFIMTSPPSPATSTTAFGIGAAVKMYNPAMENVSYYYGGRFSYGTNGGTPAVSSLYVGALAGADYWFSPRFSMGGQVNFGFGSAGASGATTTTIGTQLGYGGTASWWFN